MSLDFEKIWPKIVWSSSSSVVAVKMIEVIDKVWMRDTNLSIEPIPKTVETAFEICSISDKFI